MIFSEACQTREFPLGQPERRQLQGAKASERPRYLRLVNSRILLEGLAAKKEAAVLGRLGRNIMILDKRMLILHAKMSKLAFKMNISASKMNILPFKINSLAFKIN